MSAKQNETMIPEINSFLLRGFRWYSFRMIRKHFHAVAMLRQGVPDTNTFESDEPLIFYANHPGWWDPLTAQLICDTCFPERDFYAPIDAAALERYRILSRLGFYPIEMASTSGAANFLRCSRAILQQPNSSIWLTPEGRFCDPRDHESELMPGLAHLCCKLSRGHIIPLAMEYPFWEERQPEMLLAWGEPVNVAEMLRADKPTWSALLTQRLREAQERLAHVAVTRKTDELKIIMRGNHGTIAIYDVARRLRSLAAGRRFQATHGGKLQ